MLYFLVASAGAAENLGRYLREWGEPVRHRVRVGTYDQANPTAMKHGSAIFCDVDIMSAEAILRAQRLWAELERKGLRLFNQPGVALGRYDLLRRLHASGRNSFNVFRIAELDDSVRYPVFLRGADDHRGSRSGLLHDRAALDDAIAAQVARGAAPETLLVVEFVDTSRDGLFRKYSAVKVGNALIAHHIFVSRHWETKVAVQLPPTLMSVVEEGEFQLANPHREAVEEAFATASIRYGRIDYGVRDGKVETWEINTMPTLLKAPSYYAPMQMHAKRWFAATLNEQFLRLSRRASRARRKGRGKGKTG